MDKIFRIEEAIKPIIDGLGYELVSVKSHKPNGVDTITVYIWRQGIMELSDCEAVHNAISAPLDELNPSEDKPYTLEVSSMGLDWQLKSDDDFRRRLGEELEIVLKPSDSAKAGKKERVIGKLVNFDADTISIEALKPQSLTTVLERKNVAKATVAIKF